jgi:hypothetical protein
MTPSLDRIAWVAFLTILPVLWASGFRLFISSALTAPKKFAWSLFLVLVGFAVGALLPLVGIRNRFALLLLALPLLAIVDIRLARSNRTFLFWFRACAFEICTVFGVAALIRFLLDFRTSIPGHS